MNTYQKSQSSRFLKNIFISICTITFVIACNSSQAEERSISKKIVKGENYGELYDQGKLRTYYFYTPKSYNPNRQMPLVLVFHGDDGSGQSISNVTRFNQLAEKKGFIVVYPDGINQKWNVRVNTKGKADDVLFVSALIDHLQQQMNINTHKVYATGFSRGGILTQALACKLPNKIAGFASVAGSLPVKLKPNCQPQTPISMLTINGTNDRDVLYQGDDRTQRGALVSVSDMVNFWQSHDQCTLSNKSSQFSEDKVKTSLYAGCSNNSEVWHLAVVNGGHFWPGGASTDKSLNKFNAKLGLNASETIWNFFQRHSLP
ncbi:alpha/beta hydrolase family esterase [Nostoc sp. PA-18-2419]|uniref:extracellular catalytic domain type 1 short-chain-length polyhydroxyalkanoate depolymerase n=1 Tax=Nostoc sp. PA-18-2419 TaxID=2575443 RepID=UPI0011081F3C|nr:PHB depolymerase family esterase [Nostoc sp. PA-18-2419]